MKLAEMLNERKTTKQRIVLINERLHLAAKIQEGDKAPVEPPEELKTELLECYDKLAEAIVLINKANIETLVEGKSLMELIATRDKHVSIAAVLHKLAEHAGPERGIFSKNEVRFLPAVDIREVRKEADVHAKRARDMDNIIQAANWNTEL